MAGDYAFTVHTPLHPDAWLAGQSLLQRCCGLHACQRGPSVAKASGARELVADGAVQALMYALCSLCIYAVAGGFCHAPSWARIPRCPPWLAVKLLVDYS